MVDDESYKLSMSQSSISVNGTLYCKRDFAGIIKVLFLILLAIYMPDCCIYFYKKKNAVKLLCDTKELYKYYCISFYATLQQLETLTPIDLIYTS
jgi:hypothetical protein